MRMFTIFAAFIAATACCQEAMGQNMLFRTFFGPTTASPTVQVQAELNASQTPTATVSKNIPEVVSQKSPVVAEAVGALQFVGYDNCGRMIYRRVSSAARPMAVTRTVNTASPAATARPAPQNVRRANSAQSSSNGIDTAFWDDLLSDVEDPLDSD